MKNLVLTIALIFGLSAFSQTTSTPADTSDKVIKKSLYTKKEREKARKDFLIQIDSIGMDPEVKKSYLVIVDKHVKRLKAVNQDRKMTQSQGIFNVQKIISEQNEEVKRILNVDQYQKHLSIINRYENSIVYRIQKQ